MSETSIDRSEFLRSALRWSLTGGLAALAAVLLSRKGACKDVGACHGCAQLARCDQAISGSAPKR